MIHRTIAAVLMLLMAGVTAADDPWAALRKRPGNDDIFVVVDTSLSMAPSNGGTMPDIRSFLQDFLGNYIKQGDRVILLTFDSEASVRSVVRIEDLARDKELLKGAIGGLDPRRVIYYSGSYPNLTEVKREQPYTALGGGQWTDYCEMWKLAQSVVSHYADSTHRQLFLLFTDGAPDAPQYRPCTNPQVLDAFAKGIREDRYRMGIVALPTSGQAPEPLAARLQTVLSGVWNDKGTAERKGVRFITYDPNLGSQSILQDIMDLISSRIDLEEPQKIDLGDMYKPRVASDFKLFNRSKVARSIAVQSVTLELDGEQIPLVVEPHELRIEPGQRAALHVSSGVLPIGSGPHAGRVVVTFGSASRFDPNIVDFRVRRTSWWQTYGKYIKLVAAVLGAIVLIVWALLFYRRSLSFAPATVHAMFSGSPRRMTRDIAIGEDIPFGGGLAGADDEFMVDGQAPAGQFRRVGEDDWEIMFENGEVLRYFNGQNVPTQSPERWRFSVALNRRHTFSGILPLFRSIIQTYFRTSDAATRFQAAP